MEVQALTRNARMSPKKVREITTQIQGRKVPDAVDLLALIPRKSARLVLKTLKSAIANAENDAKVNRTADQLVVFRALVENGPVLRRFKAGPRGSAMPRRKKMAHIRIVLTDEAKQKN
jgi:large subunit ribosomal protein L22